MVNLAQAKVLVVDWLRGREETLGYSLRILDEQVEEHEWGWVIWFGPDDPSQVPPDQRDRVHLPYIVDRITGRVRPVGTYGINLSVAKLLQERQES